MSWKVREGLHAGPSQTDAPQIPRSLVRFPAWAPIAEGASAVADFCIPFGLVLIIDDKAFLP